ncbi:hypothetical protein [Barnesiella intestinihominis]|uniref:hypothetical protein n=1 Tax=Barnesiella intestinihominis TaxID=487174 RepID=UPI003AB26BE3
MPKNKIILFCFLFSWIGLHPIAAISLEKQSTVGQKIRQAIQGKNATVGVAFSIDGQLFTFNDEHRYPLMSVFKLPQIRDFPHEVLQTEEKCAFD